MLCHRGMIQMNLCPCCNQDVETTFHCLRDCKFATRLWQAIGFTNLSFFQGDDLYVWLRRGIDGHSRFLFMSACWWLWRAQNRLCMADGVVSPFSIRMCTDNYVNLLTKCFIKQRPIPFMRVIKWNDKNGNNMILNVDGSSLGNPCISGFGGLLRNEDDAWIHGFAGNIGFSNILHAELLSVYHGLRMAWEFGILELWCYSDSKTAIKLISEPVNTWHHCAAIIYNIKELLSRDWHVHMHHTIREGNACADYLAKLGAGSHETYRSIATPPARISLLLLADASRISFSR